MLMVSMGLFIFLGIFLLLIGLQVFFCKRHSKMALILPIIAACGFIIVGIPAIFEAAILFAIYFVNKMLEKEKQESLAEIEKMNIADL